MEAEAVSGSHTRASAHSSKGQLRVPRDTDVSPEFQGAPGGCSQRLPVRAGQPLREAGCKEGLCSLINLGAEGDPRSPGHWVRTLRTQSAPGVAVRHSPEKSRAARGSGWAAGRCLPLQSEFETRP